MSPDRAMQIVNNVAEEFADHGKTNFATKKELCETIQFLRKDHERQLENYSSTLLNIVLEENQALFEGGKQP